ncbi:hypothetical protein O181_010157 [Austropuccinia psidii MF-1]|uniref:Uncharacterized protein n=1 Tax=Austropuccinia psidii MF-1 TaxID=1389203 RepID=A0A9Q3GKY4_9BASI|nr:hypothetical protein [Austropuccinia psidii MF-1]
MDQDKEEARPGPYLQGLLQERDIWRIPELPHFTRYVSTTFDINSDPELIQGSILRVEPLPSGSHRNISFQVKNPYRAAKEEELEIFPSHWQGAMNFYLHIKSFLSQEKTIESLGGCIPLSCNDKLKKKDWLKNQSILSIYQKRKIIMSQYLEKEGPVLQTSSRKVQIPAQRTTEETERFQEKSRQGKRQRQLAQTLPTRVQDSQIGTFSHGHCVQYGQSPYGAHSQGTGKEEQDIYMEIINEIRHIEAIIDVELGKCDK